MKYVTYNSEQHTYKGVVEQWELQGFLFWKKWIYVKDVLAFKWVSWESNEPVDRKFGNMVTELYEEYKRKQYSAQDVLNQMILNHDSSPTTSI